MNRPKIRIGYFEKACRTRLYYPHDAHLILTAPTRSGKGRDLLIPALLDDNTKNRSCVVIDPKGQLAAVCGHHLQSVGHRVFVLNPFKILPDSFRGLIPAGFNPLLQLDPSAESFGADCDSLAEAIVYNEPGDGSFWTDSARQLVSGVIMALVSYMRPEKRNLFRVMEIISGPDFFNFCRDVTKKGNGDICARLARFAAPKANENPTTMSMVETARTAVGFISNKAIANSLAANDNGPWLRFSDLRDRPATVFLVLPTKYLATSSKWFRLVIAAAMADLLNEKGGAVPVLAMLDEFAQLGTLQIISNIMGVGAGYGLQLWPVLQDLNQLQRLYPKDWRTFLANSGAQIFFAPRDQNTAKEISDLCGVTEVHTQSQSTTDVLYDSRNRDPQPIAVNTNYGQSVRPLMHPHEVVQLSGREMIVFAENLAGPILGGRRSYLEMSECRGKYRPDPYHAKRA
jgi:type IV secretion system protein VirD4